MFSGHVEIIILKLSPASATKVRLPVRGGREGEGKGGEGEGRGKKEGEKGWGVSIWPPTSKCVATALIFSTKLNIHVHLELSNFTSPTRKGKSSFEHAFFRQLQFGLTIPPTPLYYTSYTTPLSDISNFLSQTNALIPWVFGIADVDCSFKPYAKNNVCIYVQSANCLLNSDSMAITL